MAEYKRYIFGSFFRHIDHISSYRINDKPLSNLRVCVCAYDPTCSFFEQAMSIGHGLGLAMCDIVVT